MKNLVLRSVLVLALLFGLLFAIGIVALTALRAPWWTSLLFALGMLFLQYLLGPWILQLIFKIEWRDPSSLDPALGAFIDRVCTERRIPQPRFGVIQDGNPNAFTFGHYPGDARLVVTTGLLELLDQDEAQAVVAHELGHIAHWDFVVITIASIVPLLLYLIFRAAISRTRSKDGPYLIVVGMTAYAAYVISQLITLLLSRVREYYADQFAGEVTGRPGALASALVKIAYGLATAPKNKDKKSAARLAAGRTFGIFDPISAHGLALAATGNGAVTTESMQDAMKWDLWNPWAMVYELGSTHPLAAKRIRALAEQSAALGQLPRLTFDTPRSEGHWLTFAADVFLYYLPVAMLVIGAGSIWLAATGLPQLMLGVTGAVLLLTGLTWWLRRRNEYLPRFDQARTVNSLLGETKVSVVRAIPCELEGEIIGRGVPGLFFSADLALQDKTGYMIVDYRQPLGILEFLFGWLKTDKLIGKRGKIVGWYRRGMRPYFEMRRLVLEDGEVINSYVYPLAQFLVYASMMTGVALLVLQVLALR